MNELQRDIWKRSMLKLLSLQSENKGYAAFLRENFRTVAKDEHLFFIHAARIAMVQTLLPHGNLILDLGGANCPLYQMGYPYHFEKLTLIDLPKDKRFDSYKEIVIDETCSLGKVVLRYTDMSTLTGIEDGSIDFVWSGQSIEHITEEAGQQLCNEVYRVLKNGGVFCLDTPNRRLTAIHTADIGGGYIHPEHKIEYYPEQLTQLLVGSGFSIKKACGICEMPQTVCNKTFHYEDFMLGKQIVDSANDAYIQFYHCEKNKV